MKFKIGDRVRVISGFNVGATGVVAKRKRMNHYCVLRDGATFPVWYNEKELEMETPKPVQPRFDPTKPVQTRDGRKARIICTDRSSSGGLWPIVALIEWNTSEEVTQTYHKDGTTGGQEADYDLINVPVKTSTWQNVYQYSGNMGRINYATKKEAKQVSGTLNGHLGYIRRNYEDGKFVSVEFEPV